MYGTIAKVKIKPGALEVLKGMTEAWDESPWAVAMYMFQMDADPKELFMVVISDSKETYRAYSESPESHQRYLEMMKYLEAEPEWNDGEVVYDVRY